jgi:hypothetical protein
MRCGVQKIALAIGLLLFTGGAARAAILTENFDQAGGFFGTTGTVGNTPSVPVVAGWSVQNRSTVPGTESWQSGSASSPFPPQAGTGFALVNANSTTNQNTISNWLFTPVISFNAGDQISFWTRTIAPVQFADRLQMRLSTNGASTNVGNTDLSFGDFSTLVRDINPNQTLVDYPTAWTQFTNTFPVSGTGRLAFRYFVTNGGPAGVNSNMIGIDSLNIVSVPEPLSAIGLTTAAGCAMLIKRRRRA